MLKEKFLLEYLGGTKGDFFANILVFNKLDLSFKNNNKSNARLKNIKFFSNEEGYAGTTPTVEEFSTVIKSLPNENFTAHQLFFLTNDTKYFEVLASENFKIYKICFEKNHYKTIQLESIFKNIYYTQVTGARKETIEKFKKSADSDEFTYLLDFEMFKKNIPLNDTNRAHFLEEKLKAPVSQHQYNLNDYTMFSKFNSLEQKANKIIFNYNDLYVDVKLSNYQQFNFIDLARYQRQLDKTWLPSEIVLFGNTWKPKDYGYMNF